ncbi:Mitochondrial 2-oxoglutarate/malate carrier protein [Aphelenchoides fujianensis]|nr:Mitochondrial 2-oxoglutarate/malate carrier protein [Aphelenchoides fujianensis]
MATTVSSNPNIPPVRIPNAVKFAFGGLAGMGATLFVQPLDLVKNRMQLSGTSGKKEYRSSFHALRSIIANEGLLTVYTGLSAGLARQATYTTTRLGVYTWLQDKAPSFAMKAALGMTAGAVGSFVGNPTEVALIRMTSDGRLPPAERIGRNYKNVTFNASRPNLRPSKLQKPISEEGVLALWRGVGPTIGRAMAVNAAQLATYSQAKQSILATNYVQDGILCHFIASMISGLATTIASMPLDIAKTRIQNMRAIDGKPEYKGMIDVLTRVIKTEGVLSLYKGFTPYYFRLGPHTVLTFIILEQMNKAYFKMVLGTTAGSCAL